MEDPRNKPTKPSSASSSQTKAGAAKAAPKKTGGMFEELFDLFSFSKTGAESGAKKTHGPIKKFSILDEGPIVDDVLLNDGVVYQRHRRLLGLLWLQSLTVAGLAILLIIAYPLLRPIYIYNVMSPDQQVGPIVGLDVPNVTKRALLSWSATSITEILTFGFGDFDRQLASQRGRFTSRGWDGFLDAIEQQGLRKQFKSNQLVLTTAPSDVPVVVAEGLNEEKEYQWNVEMPVIMTFLTNNDVKKRQSGLIRLEIVRVPSRENIQGIAIQSWQLQ